MYKQKALAIFLSVLVLMSFSFAQTQTGGISGNIKDASGESLPGVNISIQSPSLIQPILATSTNQKGFFRFVNLPPGFYSLTAEMQGFKRTERKDIRVFLGETVAVDLVMEQGVLDETIDVTATLPTVDVTKSEVSSVFTTEMLTSLPFRSHDMGLIDITPGISDRAANGSSPGSNQYQLDGQNVTDQWWGIDNSSINYDIIEESEVTSAGGKAEFGEYTGAVVNAVTKSGGNTFEGQASFYFYNDKLVSYRKNEIAPPATSYDTSLLLGGPIKKDRVWFFIAGAYRRDSTKSLDLPDPIPTTNTRPYVYGKVNYLVDKNNKGFLSFQYDKYTKNQGNDRFRSELSLQHRVWETYLVNFQHQIQLGANTLLEAKFNYKSYEGAAVPTHPELPFIYDLATGYMSGAGVTPNGDDTKRYRIMLDFTHYADDFLNGHHEFKVGVTFDKSKGTNFFEYPGESAIYLYNGEPIEKIVQDHKEIVPEAIQEYDAYAQDAWTIKRLTLNLGLRWSYSSPRVLDVVTPSGEKIKGRGQMYEWSNISPRIGLSYALTNDNKTVLRMSWGRFYDANNFIIFYGYGPYSQTISHYFWDPASQDWAFVGKSGPATNQDVDPNLKRYYSNVLTLGIQRQLMADLSIELNYAHKYFGNQLGYVNTAGEYAEQAAIDPATGNAFTVYNQTNVGDNFYYLTNPEKLEYKYDGIDLIATKRFSHDWFAQASFHWQKCEGLGTNDTYERSAWSETLKDPNNTINATGPVALDRTYMFKLMASYLIRPIGLNTAVIFNYTQGPRYGRQFEVLLNQGYMFINGVPKNSLVGDPLSTLDVRLEKLFTLSGLNIGILLDVRNVFNSDNATTLSNLYETQTTARVRGIQNPRYFQLGLRIGF